jgi:hypothetical protein
VSTVGQAHDAGSAFAIAAGWLIDGPDVEHLTRVAAVFRQGVRVR